MKRTCDPDADSALDVTMAEWRRMTGHADDSGVPTTYVQLLVPRAGQATLVLPIMCVSRMKPRLNKRV